MTRTINTGDASYRSTNLGGGASRSVQSSSAATSTGGGIIWTPSNPVSGPASNTGSSTGTGSTAINGTKSTSLGAGTITPGVVYTSSTGTSVGFSLIGGGTKTDIQYLVVLNDGSVLEFEEVGPLTAKEMIGISKFFAAVAKIGYSGVAVKWSEVIDKLGIRRHFKPGTGHESTYNSSGHILYVKLIDAP